MNAGGRLLSGAAFSYHTVAKPQPYAPPFALCRIVPTFASVFFIGDNRFISRTYRDVLRPFLFVGAAAFVSAQRRKSAFQASTRKPRRRKDGKQARKGRFSFAWCILSPFACNVSECNEKQRHGRYLRVKGAIC